MSVNSFIFNQSGSETQHADVSIYLKYFDYLQCLMPAFMLPAEGLHYF